MSFLSKIKDYFANKYRICKLKNGNYIVQARGLFMYRTCKQRIQRILMYIEFNTLSSAEESIREKKQNKDDERNNRIESIRYY